MAHAPKPNFVFRRNGRVHLNLRGASVHSTTGSRVVRISGSNAGYTMFRGSVKSTGYPLYSPVSPSLPLPCVTVCHHISTVLYYSNKSLSRCNNFPVYYPDVYLQLNLFSGVLPTIIRSSMTAVAASGFTFVSW